MSSRLDKASKGNATDAGNDIWSHIIRTETENKAKAQEESNGGQANLTMVYVYNVMYTENLSPGLPGTDRTAFFAADP